MNRWVIAALAALGSIAAVHAGPVEDFYRGKNVTMYIGYSAGGGYDVYARMLARHLGAHIPGKPNIIAQNMPGAGSLKVATYLSEVAPRDGTAFGTFARGMPLYPMLFTPDFDATKLGYVGSITSDTSVCITWGASRIHSWDDLMTRPSVFGGEGKGSDPDLFATLLKEVFNTQVRLVSGYPGTADITLAMERGEIDGLCGISYSTLKSVHADWLAGHKISIIVQAALQKDPALPDVPSMLDLATETSQKQIVALAVAPQAMARPFVVPPTVPSDRLAALRKAFDETMTDPEFLADAANLNLDVNPMSGAEIGAMVERLYQTPRDVIAKAASAMGAK